MENTIGKRIAQNRKRLKLTQDALAEQLGVTAQAVSKWENDQSCPDISTLPRLAEIFGITTDELLGKEKVYEAEPVTPPQKEKDGNKWEVTWDAGRRSSIFLALGVLIFGGLLFVGRILEWQASWWDLLWPTALLVGGLYALIPKFSFFGIGCMIFGGYFLVSNIGLWQLSFAGELIFPAIVLIFGLSLLADALKKPKKSQLRIKKNGEDVEHIEKNAVDSCTTDNTTFECDTAFANTSHKIVLDQLSHGQVDCSFATVELDLSGCATVSDGCTVEADCSFGHLTVLVPDRFRVEATQDTAFASLKILGQPKEECDGVIRLDADISFGNIEIHYI